MAHKNNEHDEESALSRGMGVVSSPLVYMYLFFETNSRFANIVVARSISPSRACNDNALSLTAMATTAAAALNYMVVVLG